LGTVSLTRQKNEFGREIPGESQTGMHEEKDLIKTGLATLVGCGGLGRLASGAQSLN